MLYIKSMLIVSAYNTGLYYNVDLISARHLTHVEQTGKARNKIKTHKTRWTEI